MDIVMEQSYDNRKNISMDIKGIKKRIGKVILLNFNDGSGGCQNSSTGRGEP